MSESTTITFNRSHLETIKKAGQALRKMEGENGGKNGDKDKATQDGGESDPNITIQSMEEQLKEWVAAIEELTEEKAGIGEGISAIYQKAKRAKYNVKAIKEVVKLRRLERMVRAEQVDAVKQYLEIVEQ
jgi:uncharacterized protein (UPF0335 family)